MVLQSPVELRVLAEFCILLCSEDPATLSRFYDQLLRSYFSSCFRTVGTFKFDAAWHAQIQLGTTNGMS